MLGWTVLALMMAFVVLWIIAAVIIQSTCQRKHKLQCPHCGGSLLGFTGQIAIATSNCGRCGARIFSD